MKFAIYSSNKEFSAEKCPPFDGYYVWLIKSVYVCGLCVYRGKTTNVKIKSIELFTHNKHKID